MSKKLTYEFVKSEIEKTGYKLLSKDYINNTTKLEIKCDKGHIYKANWASFKSGRKCIYCHQNIKLTYEFVKNYIEEQGCKLLSIVYINNSRNLKIKCKNGHTYTSRFGNFKSGRRCPHCYGKTKLTYEFVKSEIEKNGYKLLSKEYVNCNVKLKIKCNKDHIYEANWNSFHKGSRCTVCRYKKTSGNKHPMWKGGVTENNIPLYDTYAPQLKFCEEVRCDPKNKDILQVKCTNSGCRKWFTPTRTQAMGRITALNSYNGLENRFYCSDNCKHSCVVYGQKLYPKDNKPYVSRADQTEWANLVKERDNYTCQRCGSTKKLVAHHIEGLNENPIESADIDLGITLCKTCHNLAHSELGCRPIDLTKNNLCKEIN